MTKADRVKTAVGRRAVLGALLAAVTAASTLGGASAALADPVDLAVVDRETGQTLQVWRHQGRLFVAGRPGARYALRVTNNTPGRVLAVLSVDGVNIVSGETAGYDQRGYILEPYRSYDLTGWRKSTSEVAAFTFAPLPQSYAARTGRPTDVGVIGMAVFSERPRVVVAPVAPPVSRDSAPRAGRGAPPPAAAPPPVQQMESGALAAAPERREERLGTGHGAIEYSASSVRPFERASNTPFFVWQVEYDTRANLVARGVIPAEPRPRPFPGGAGFVPDPPIWR